MAKKRKRGKEPHPRWTDNQGLVLKRRAPAGAVDVQNDAVELGMLELSEPRPPSAPKRR